MEPVPVRVLKLLDNTSGRDRVCRFVQYTARLVSWLLEEDEGAVLRAKTLESSISTARKLFRLGKSLDHLRLALQTIHLANPVHRLLITLSKINQGLYLLLDHVVWAAKMKLLQVDATTWNKAASRFWALAVLFGLLRDIYDFLMALRVEQSRVTQDQGRGVRKPMSTVVCRTMANHPSIMVDLMKNATDIFIPLSNLQLVHLSPGAVGVMGMVSSLCGLLALWSEPLKLRYS